MKDYVKAILYAYPLLKTVGKDYEEHIKNRALLSYAPRRSALATAEYLAGEILEMRKLEWLKDKLDGVLLGLTDLERTLLAVRYFGKKKTPQDLTGNGLWKERTYFRKQSRLGEKVTSALTLTGVTEEIYARDFENMALFGKIQRFLSAGKDKKISARERSWLTV